MNNEARKHVVIAGGGVAAVETLLALRALAGDTLAVTLLAPEHDFAYRALATGDPFTLTHVERRPLAQIAADNRAMLLADALAAVDTPSRTIRTAAGSQLEYDYLVLATGAHTQPPLEHALTFRGPEDIETFHGLVQDVEGGYTNRLAFVIPTTRVWALPIYELALMTARRAREMWISNLALTIVTAEPKPLDIFGARASDAVGEMLRRWKIDVVNSSHVREDAPQSLTIQPLGRHLTADRVVAAPLLFGPALPGVPSDSDGFIPTDEHGRVGDGLQLFAAGDATAYAIKQGGISAQQADAVAEAIAADVGALAEAAPFRPVLRGMLLTGSDPAYFRTGADEGEAVSDKPLWWPPEKVAGRFLAPYLGSPAGAAPAASAAEMLPVDRPLPANLSAGEIPESYRRFGHFAEVPVRTP